MKQEPERKAELASALADGELRGAELAQAVTVVATDEEARAQWHAYHLVGDVLRMGTSAAMGAPDPAFAARLRQRIQQDTLRDVPGQARAMPENPSANDSLWRWKLAAGLGMAASVAVLGWHLAGPMFTSRDAIQMAAGTGDAGLVMAASPVSGQAGRDGAAVMIRDPRLDQLIAAHQQLGGASALQMPAGFVRNATFQRPAR